MGDLVPTDDLPGVQPARPSTNLVPDDDLPSSAPAEPGEQLRTTADAVGSVNPDAHAKVLRLSRESGVPAELVAVNPTGFEQGGQVDWVKVHRESPGVAKFLSDPGRMALARDDTDALGRAEGAITGQPSPTDQGPFVLAWEALKKGWAGLQLSWMKTQEQTGIAPSRAAISALAGSLGTDPFSPEGIAAGRAARQQARALAESAPAPFTPEEQQAEQAAAERDLGAQSLLGKIWAGTFTAIPSVAGFVAATAVAGPPGAMVFAGGTTYGGVREKLGELKGPAGQKLTSGQQTAGAAAITAPVAAIQSIGLGPLIRSIGGPALDAVGAKVIGRAAEDLGLTTLLAKFALRTGGHTVLGAGTMAASTAMEEAGLEIGRKGLDPSHEFNLEEVASRAYESFKAAATDFALLSAFGAGRQFFRERGLSALAAAESRQIEAEAKAAQDSKLLDRSPEELEALVQQVAPGEVRYVDKVAWNTYWQQQKIDPRTEAARLLQDGGNGYDAATEGGLLAVPVDRWLSQYGKTKHIVALKDDVKITPEGRTPREEAAFQQQDQRMAAEVEAARGAEFEADKRRVAKIVSDKAEGAGIDAEEAKAVAQMVGEFAGSVSLRTGIPVDQVAAIAGVGRLRILGAKGEQLIQDAQAELLKQMSPDARATIEAARSGDRRAQARLEAQAYIEPLTQLLNRAGFEDYRQNRKAGGWDVAIDANDLSAQDLFGGHETGNKLLVAVADAMRAAREETGGAGRLFRWGGDEFHAGGFKNQAEAQAFAEALQRKLGAAPEVAPGFKTSVSVGIGPDISTADAAMYEAKAAKKAKWGGFNKAAPEESRKNVGHGETFIAAKAASVIPKGETEITKIGGRPVTLEQADRGVIRMRLDATGKPVDFNIQALAADKSTFAHETGHFLSWAMHDLAADARGEMLRPDYRALLKWAGIGSEAERLQSNLERAGLEGRENLTGKEKARLQELNAREERIAYGWEQYLSEGKAPTAALQRAFSRFKGWMTRIYQGLLGLNEQYSQRYGQDISLSDDVRGVFDRWLAAETEVRQVEALGDGPAVADLLARLPAADRADLQRARDDRRAAAESGVFRALKRAEEIERGDLRERLRQEVDAKIGEEPVYNLLDYLKRPKTPEAGVVAASLGELDPTLLDEHGSPWKLDRAALVDQYGEDFVRTLPRGITAKGGAPADFLAEKFGFASGDEMVRSLQGAKSRAAEVEKRTQDRLEQLYPSMKDNPEGVVQAAVDAEHSPEAAEEALIGARILARQVDPALGVRLRTMSDAKARKATAERLVSDMRASDVSPQRFLQAERRHAREAVELTARALGRETANQKELAAKAMDAREAQLLNMALWRAARDAQLEVGKVRDYLRDMTRDEARARLGKATSTVENPGGGYTVSQPYLDRVDDLLGRIDFSKGEAKFNRRQRFQEWLEAQPQDAQDDILSRIKPSVLAKMDQTQHWSELTVQELRDLRDAVETIEAQAKLKSKLRTGKTDRDRETAIGAAVKEIKSRFAGGEMVLLERAQPIGEKIKSKIRKTKEWVMRPEEAYRQLGPEMTQLCWEPISNSEVRFQQLIREVTAPVMKEIEGLSGAERKALREKFVIDGNVFDGEAVVALLLNWGNDSNRQKVQKGGLMLGGRFQKIKAISSQTVETILKHVTRPQAELVNRIWTQLSSKWEEIAALEKHHTGLAPPKIEAKPFTLTLADGSTVEMTGGYYPVIYDRRFSTAGQRMGESIDKGLGAMAFMSGSERAVTPQGHLQARLESFARPVDLSLSALPRHVTMTMKDLAMRDPLISVRDVLTDGRIRDAIQEAIGQEGYNILLDHWHKAANEYALAKGVPDWLNHLKIASSGAVFAGNIGLAIQNFANFIPALQRIPAKYLAAGMKEFAVKRLSLFEEIYKLSPYMYERMHYSDPTISRAISGATGRRSKAEQLADETRRVGMWMMETTDAATAAPAWWGEYQHGIDPVDKGGLGLSQERAVANADQTIRLTMSSYRTIDRSKFETGPVTKQFSMFYGYMNSQLNMLIGAHADSKLLKHQGFRMAALRRVAKTYALLMAGGVVSDLLVGKGPQDDDKDGEIGPGDWAKWAAMRAILYPPSTLPVAGAFLNQIAGPGQGRDVSLTPWTRIGTSMANAARETRKAMSEEAAGDEAFKAGLAALETVGWWYGLPVVQFRRTGDYWLDITPDGFEQSPESDQASIPEAVFGTAYGKKAPGRLSESIFGR